MRRFGFGFGISFFASIFERIVSFLDITESMRIDSRFVLVLFSSRMVFHILLGNESNIFG